MDIRELNFDFMTNGPVCKSCPCDIAPNMNCVPGVMCIGSAVRLAEFASGL
jgi:hypothetical protein